MEENNIIEMEEVTDINQEDQEVETCEVNPYMVGAIFGGACVAGGVLLAKVGKVVIPKVVSGAKKVGRGFKNLFTKKNPDNVVDGDFEVVEDEVFEDDEKAN